MSDYEQMGTGAEQLAIEGQDRAGREAPVPVLSTHRSIVLRGVEVHNLKGVNLDIPHRQLVVVCGLSGSGKTSLALDTLYAEGQRRYIETFSAYTRQFFERLEKPAAERISGIPPAVAVTHKNPSRSSRATVGTTTEAYDYLRLLFAKIGQVFCLTCGRPVRRETPESTADALAELPAGIRYLLAFTAGNGPAADDPAADRPAVIAGLREEGFARAIIDHRLLNLNDAPQLTDSTTSVDAATTSEVVLRIRLIRSRTVGNSRRRRPPDRRRRDAAAHPRFARNRLRQRQRRLLRAGRNARAAAARSQRRSHRPMRSTASLGGG